MRLQGTCQPTHRPYEYVGTPLAAMRPFAHTGGADLCEPDHVQKDAVANIHTGTVVSVAGWQLVRTGCRSGKGCTMARFLLAVCGCYMMACGMQSTIPQSTDVLSVTNGTVSQYDTGLTVIWITSTDE